MNVNNIQAIQFWQKAIGYNGKDVSSANAKGISSSTQTLKDNDILHISTEGMSSGIDYLRRQLQVILTSFPPFFPAGSPQRADMIKKIKSIEEQIAKSSMAADLKKMVGESKLSEKSSDQEITGALNNLSRVKETLTQQHQPATAMPSQPGLHLNLKI